MILQDPTSAAVAAGIAVPAVLALYLLKLRRRPVRVSSVAFWEAAAADVQANVPLKWLRMSLLLVLHLLIIASLCLALGRPIDADAKVDGRRAYLLLDCSASMQAMERPHVTRFELARLRAIEAARELTRAGASVGLVTYAAESRLLVPPTRRAAVLEAAIEGCSASDQPGKIASALQIVRGSVPPDAAEGTPLPIARCITDSMPREAVESGGLLLRYDIVGDTGTAPDNLGIVAMNVSRDSGDPSSIGVFLKILNSGPQLISAPIAISSGGVVLDRFTVEVPAATSAGCGQAAQARHVRMSLGGVIEARLTRQDQLGVDDVALASVPPPRAIKVLYVAPEATAQQYEQASEWMIFDVLKELHADRLERVRPSKYQQMLDAGEVAAFDVAIFDRVTPAAPPPVPSLSLGGSIAEPGLTLGEEVALNDGPVFWERQHPVLRDAPLDTLFISKQRVLPDAQIPGVKVLVRGTKGPLMCLRTDPAPRRLVAAFALRDSNWPLQAGFPIFLSETLRFLTGSSIEGSVLNTGESVRVSTSNVDGTLLLKGPVERSVPLAAVPGNAERREIVLEPLERAGTYQVIGPRAEPSVLAVSLLSQGESDLRRTPAPEATEESVRAGLTETGRQLWPWCVLSALVLLAIEWVLFGWQSRR